MFERVVYLLYGMAEKFLCYEYVFNDRPGEFSLFGFLLLTMSELKAKSGVISDMLYFCPFRCVAASEKVESLDNVFHKRWKLYEPVSLKEIIDKGIGDYDTMG